jgi:hypothetical protein
MLNGSKIEEIIREQTGIGPMTTNQAQYFQVLIRAAFHCEGGVLVMYLEKEGQMTIYLMPTDQPNEQNPSLSPSLSKQKFDSYNRQANEWLEKLLKKSKDFSGLTAFYEFKIVHRLPKDVVESERLRDQASQ